MKKFMCLFGVLLISQVCCFADWNTYETRQEAYDRRSYENYNTYQNNNYQAPLGGYNRSMNDNGGNQYGMNNNGSFNSNSGFNNYNNRNSNSWNSF